MKNDKQYLYFLTIPGNESLLKEEIRLSLPKLKFAYSCKGFCTFKNNGSPISLYELSRLNIIFALTYGETAAKITLKDVANEYHRLSSELKATINFHQTESIQQAMSKWIPEKQIECSGDLQIDFIRTDNDSVFIGRRELDPWKSPLLRRFSPIRTDIISRAYYKAADAFCMFPVNPGRHILELGCVPGGITQYLLENGHVVTGVDPAKANEVILSNPNFKFENIGVHDYRPPRNELIDTLISDMNLAPKIVLKECIRLSKNLPNLKQAFITCKINGEKMLQDLDRYKSLMQEMGFKTVHFVQLPYHRHEFLAYGNLQSSRKNKA